MAEFARKIGVSVNTYQHYEYGRRAPSLAFIEKICHELDVSSDWLLGLDERDSPSGVSVTAGEGAAVAASGAGNATVTPPSTADLSTLLSVIASQQRTIERLLTRAP